MSAINWTLISDHNSLALGRGARREVAIRYCVWGVQGRHVPRRPISRRDLSVLVD